MELDPQTKFYLAVKRMADKWSNYFKDTQLHWRYHPHEAHYLSPEETDRKWWVAMQLTKCGERLQEILMVYEQESEIEKRYDS